MLHTLYNTYFTNVFNFIFLITCLYPGQRNAPLSNIDPHKLCAFKLVIDLQLVTVKSDNFHFTLNKFIVKALMLTW